MQHADETIGIRPLAIPTRSPSPGALELVQLLDGVMASTVYGGPEVEMIGQWTCRTEMYSDRIGMARIINPNSSTMR